MDEIDFTSEMERVWFETIANPDKVKDRISSRLKALKEVALMNLGCAAQTCTFFDGEMTTKIYDLIEEFCNKHPEAGADDADL